MNILETTRLAFRNMDVTDFDSLLQLDGDPTVRTFFPKGTLSAEEVTQKIEQNQKSFTQYGFSDFIVENKVTHQFLGRAGFARMEDGEVEVGYLFLKNFWGLGYATEAVEALLTWAFDQIPPSSLAHGRFISFAPLHHFGSHKVMEKAGMTYFKDDLYQGVQCKFYQIKRP